MLRILTCISSLLIGYALLFVGNAMLTTLISLRAQLEGFLTTHIGLINAAYFLGLYIGAKFTDSLVSRVGHGRAYAVFASVGVTFALLHAIVIDPYVWMVIRVGTGICIAGLMMITESWLNAGATNTNRGKVLSLYMITHFLASGFGQLLIPLADISDFTLFTYAAIGFSLSLVPVLTTRMIAPPLPARQKVKFKDVYKFSPVGMTGGFVIGAVAAILYGLTPLFTQGIGLSTTTTATFMATIILSGVILQLPIGYISDRLDRRVLIAIVSLVSGLLSIGIYLSAEINMILFFVVGGLFGAVVMTIYPIAIAHVNDATPADKLLYAAAGILTAFSTGAVIGPIFASFLVEKMGYAAMFIFQAALLVLYALIVIWRSKVKSAPKKKKFRRCFRAKVSSDKRGIDPRKVRDEMDRDLARLVERDSKKS